MLQKGLTKDPSDRAYILDRLRLLILTLADGSPAAAEETANQTFDLLRTQGLNDDKTVSAAVFNERVKIWKGEPFEQAMAYAYIAMQKAELGQWDNARAAAQSSLFLLKDFGDNERGGKKTSEDVVREAARLDRQGKDGDAYIDHGYTPVKTDFALGYLLNGLANKALGGPDRDNEASDNFHEAANVNPFLAPLTQALLTGQYNTVFIVDAGVGPRKTAYGPDDALVRFLPVFPSDGRTLRVTAGGQIAEYPVANDLNVMAADLQWNNLEDVRQAKSTIGDLLVVGGIAAAAYPSSGHESSQARTNRALIGAGVALLGAALKASASADTRYCEFLPQRVYVAPVFIAGPDAAVTLSVGGDPSQTITLTNLAPPAAGKSLQLRYVKLTPRPEAWQTAGALVYANDRTEQRVPGDGLPYIMGGTCCRRPTSETLLRYQQAGFLRDMTSAAMENLYREEGITFTVEDQRGGSAAHILEGGTSMVCPLAGTAGYMRLFGQAHPPYVPKSEALKEAIAREVGQTQRQ